jgi:hypothetical protein
MVQRDQSENDESSKRDATTSKMSGIKRFDGCLPRGATFSCLKRGRQRETSRQSKGDCRCLGLMRSSKRSKRSVEVVRLGQGVDDADDESGPTDRTVVGIQRGSIRTESNRGNEGEQSGSATTGNVEEPRSELKN